MSNSTVGVRHHLSFSGTVQRGDGLILLIRRRGSNSEKSMGAAPWSHPLFGAPRPAETLPAAVKRSAERELGITMMTVEPLRPLLTAESLGDGMLAEAHPSYIVKSDENPDIPAGFEPLWGEPLAIGARARHYPQEFSHVFVGHATLLPFFGGIPDAGSTLAFLRERATG